MPVVCLLVCCGVCSLSVVLACGAFVCQFVRVRVCSCGVLGFVGCPVAAVCDCCLCVAGLFVCGVQICVLCVIGCVRGCFVCLRACLTD